MVKLNDWKECILIKKEIEELRNLCKTRELSIVKRIVDKECEKRI